MCYAAPQHFLDNGDVTYEHVIKDVVDEPHVEHVVVALVQQVLVRGDVVADEVVGLPAAEEREPRTDLQLDGFVQDPESRGRDVPDVVAVVRVGGWQDKKETLKVNRQLAPREKF